MQCKQMGLAGLINLFFSFSCQNYLSWVSKAKLSMITFRTDPFSLLLLTITRGCLMQNLMAHQRFQNYPRGLPMHSIWDFLGAPWDTLSPSVRHEVKVADTKNEESRLPDIFGTKHKNICLNVNLNQSLIH